jgi:metallo-beta-lactamase class B
MDLRLGLLAGAAFGLWNLLSWLLDPLAEDTPMALLTFYGPMFTVWGVAGFGASRRTGRILHGMKTGTTVAFVTFVVLTLAVMARVNLFFEVTSRRPDWQNLVAGFPSSGFRSLRAYANWVYLTGAPFKIMVASMIGAGTGLFGGLLGSLGRRDVQRTPFLVALVLGSLSPAAVAQGQPSAPAIPDSWKAFFEPAEPFRVVGPIHFVGTADLGVYLVATKAGLILIDGAMPTSAPLLEGSIRKLGFEPKEIRLLLITQAHVDHVGTLAHFKKLTGAKVAVMGPDDELLRSGGKTDYLFQEPRFRFDPVTADRVLKDGDVVELGGVRLTARRTPGHTRGTTTWITSVEDAGRAYQVVFPGSTSVNPGTRLLRNPSYPGIADDYRRSFRLLESLKPDIFLAAHAGFFDRDAKRARAASEGVRAWVDLEGFRRRIAESKASFEALVAKEAPENR